MSATDLILLTLWLSLGVQAVFFVFAATFKTDKVTDLSYGLTFILLAVVLIVIAGRAAAPSRTEIVLVLMVIAWGIRLASYLLYRIITIKRDARFDGVREHFWKFFQFWLFQGLTVWVVMAPVTVWFANPGPWSALKSVAFVIWFAGLAIETVADIQKFRQKRGADGKRKWMDTGLWRYSRHPNYFGELLCWWGVFLFVAADLTGLGWLTIVGPLSLTYLLLFVTGIPTLDKSAREKWGSDPAYQAYRRRTSMLVLWPPSAR